MGADTFASRGINSVVWKGIPKIREFRANGTDIKPGRVVSTVGDTFPDAHITSAGEAPVGIILERYDTDIDTAYSDNDEHVPIALIAENPGLGVFLFETAGAGDIKHDLKAATDDDGKVKIWAYTDGAAATDSEVAVIGHFAEDASDDASNDKLRKVLL